MEILREMAENELTALLKTLNQTQIEFVIARLGTKSDKEAAETIGIAPWVAYNWPNKGDVNRAIQLTLLNSFEIAREKLSRLMPKAVGVLDEEMNGDKKLKAACEVLDRGGLAVKGQLDVTTGGEKLSGGFTDDQRLALLIALAERSSEATIGQDSGE